jgi:hypothetical protein
MDCLIQFEFLCEICNVRQIYKLALLLVGRLMSYLRYSCSFAYSGVVFNFSRSCVPYVASFSALSNFDCPFGILYRLLNKHWFENFSITTCLFQNVYFI